MGRMPQPVTKPILMEEKPLDIQTKLRNLSNERPIGPPHRNYLTFIREQLNLKEPKVIYDIGACVLHWTTLAKDVWPNAEYIAFEAAEDLEFLYKENNITYQLGVLSNEDNKPVNFYLNIEHPGGNSYYRENTKKFYPHADEIYSDLTAKKLTAMSLDTIVKQRNFPLPDLIKIDVQGAELDIIKGAKETIKSVKHIILELQEVDFNQGAPNAREVIDYMSSIGFDCMYEKFSQNDFDADYHFVNRNLIDK
jgi:FkbM family methyltransferase